MIKNIGILAIQGSFAEHKKSILKLKHKPVLIKYPEEIDNIDALIIPGGESTTMGKFLHQYGFIEKIRQCAYDGLPIYGTCAGMIILAKEVKDFGNPTIAIMDILIKRNAFGRQLDSFEEDIAIPAIGKGAFRGIFIRAPLIEGFSKDVKVLAQLDDQRVVSAEQNNLLVTAFHPELTNDLRIHQYFVNKI